MNVQYLYGDSLPFYGILEIRNKGMGNGEDECVDQEFEGGILGNQL